MFTLNLSDLDKLMKRTVDCCILFLKEVISLNRIRKLRTEKEMKQATLADMLNCTTATVSKYELEQREITASTICTLCEIFDCSSDYLLGLSARRKWELSEEEENLLLAWRKSDNRAKDMVTVALAPFGISDSQNATA